MDYRKRGEKASSNHGSSSIGGVKMKEHDRVVLKCELPDQGLEAGDVGTIVHIYKNGEAFEVEFVSLDGETTVLATVSSSQVRSVHRREITHARQMETNLTT